MDSVAAKLKSGDFTVVKTDLAKLAESGDARAQFNLAVSYAHGNGVEKNYDEAFKWYKKSAEQHYTRAEFNLASSYMSGQGTERSSAEAIKWYQAAAGSDDLAANLALGNIYSRGSKDITIEQNKAFQYYSAAAAKGSEEADFNLGGMYLFGTGTEKNADKAIEIYNRLAANGNDKAAMILGEIYESDKYVSQDLPRAFAWYEAQYNATHNLLAKDRVEVIKTFLTPEQIKAAEKIKASIAVPVAVPKEDEI